MTEKDNCKHVKGEWSWRGEKFPYTAHITTVKGPRPSEEIVDDVHVDATPAALPIGLQKWLQEPCDACKRIRETWKDKMPRSNSEAMTMAREVAEAMNCHHHEGELFGEIARGALDIYMLKGPTPDE